MLNIAICDDEPMMAEELSGQLSAYLAAREGPPWRVSRFADGRSLLDCGRSFDLTFLDIRMAQPDGLETARLLRQRGDHSLLVFVTVLRECVFDAFGVEAWDYLLKPLDGERLAQTMDRALRELERRQARSLFVRQGGGCRIIPLSRILYCEVQGRKVYLHQEGGEVVDYYQRLGELEGELDRRFFRCHRSYLVNLDRVLGCGGGQVTLAGGERVPLSRLRERALLEALLRQMKERRE